MLKNKVLYLLVGFSFSLFMFQAVVSHAGQVELGDSIALTAGFPGDMPFKPKVAFNSKHNEYLVVYHWKNIFFAPIRQVHAARMSADGQYIENFVISDLPNDCASVDVAYDPAQSRHTRVSGIGRRYDRTDWNVHGRFVPYDGPSATLSSFPISEQKLWDEFTPRLAYGGAQKDFLLVVNLLRNNGDPLKSYIGGIRIKADGSGTISGGPDFTIIKPAEHLINPDIAYNSYRDEYMVVYDNASDVYATIVNGETLSTGSEIPMTELESPYVPLPGTHDRAAVSFAKNVQDYVITWDTDRLSGLGKIYARIYWGGDLGTNAAYIYRVDDDLGGARPDFTSDVACKASGECLILWIAVHNNTYFTFGRQIFSDSGSLDNGFPYNNLNTIATWDSYDPQLAVGAGTKNYFMGFESYIGTTKFMYGRPTLIPPFPWIIFLPAINNGSNP